MGNFFKEEKRYLVRYSVISSGARPGGRRRGWKRAFSLLSPTPVLSCVARIPPSPPLPGPKNLNVTL